MSITMTVFLPLRKTSSSHFLLVSRCESGREGIQDWVDDFYKLEGKAILKESSDKRR